MTISSTLFFRDATLKLCSSLSMNTALGESFAYIRTIMPAEGLILGLNKPGNSSINTIARVAPTGAVENPDGSAHGQLWKRIDEEWTKGSELDLFQDLDSNETQIKKTPTLFFHEDRSYLVLQLAQEKKSIGGIALYAKGRNQFKKEHAHLIAALYAPLVLVLSLWQKQQELLGVKQLFVKDILHLQEQINALNPDPKPIQTEPSTADPEPFKSLDEMMTRHIQKALDLTGGRVEGEKGSAALLGIHHSTLRARMRKLGIAFGKKRKKRDS